MGVFVAFPSFIGVRPATTGMLVQLMVSLSKAMGDSELSIVAGCSDLRSVRSDLAYQFVRKTKHSRMLMLDDDMVLDISTITRMFNTKADVVAVAYKKRVAPHIYCVQTLDGVSHPVESPMRVVEGERLAEVAAVGLGCMLVHRRVIKTLYEKYLPELAYYVEDEEEPRCLLFQNGTHMHGGKPRIKGEDWGFCLRLREAGFKIEILVDAPVDHAGVPGNYAEFFPEKSPA